MLDVNSDIYPLELGTRYTMRITQTLVADVSAQKEEYDPVRPRCNACAHAGWLLCAATLCRRCADIAGLGGTCLCRSVPSVVNLCAITVGACKVHWNLLVQQICRVLLRSNRTQIGRVLLHSNRCSMQVSPRCHMQRPQATR